VSAVTGKCEGACVAPSRDSRHDETDRRWQALGYGEELVLLYPHETYKVGAVITAQRALELIAEHAPALLVSTLVERVRHGAREEVKT
jgi:hypothetical protein